MRGRARSTSAACSTRSAPTSTWRRSSRGSRHRCSSARRSPTSACATCSTRSSTSRRRRARGSTSTACPRPIDSPCSAFVFKVQANMDRSHRDRIAFVRICSGRFERGMVMTSARTGKPFATKYASTVFGAERSTVDEAFPGDVVGLVNANGLNIGDSLYDGDPVEFPPIPRFSPEVFASARPLDSGRFKQFRRGLAQLDEEGVVQVLRDPDMGDSAPVLAAVGQLQFEVFANRLDIEFGAPIEVLSSPYEAIRLTDADVGRPAASDRRDPDPRARRRRAGGAVREPLPAAADRVRRTRAAPRPHRRRLTATARAIRRRQNRRWHDFVMTKEPSGGAVGGASLPVVPAGAPRVERSWSAARVLLAPMPPVGLGGPATGVGVATQRGRVGDRPRRARRAPRRPLRPRLCGRRRRARSGRGRGQAIGRASSREILRWVLDAARPLRDRELSAPVASELISVMT